MRLRASTCAGVYFVLNVGSLQPSCYEVCCKTSTLSNAPNDYAEAERACTDTLLLADSSLRIMMCRAILHVLQQGEWGDWSRGG